MSLPTHFSFSKSAGKTTWEAEVHLTPSSGGFTARIYEDYDDDNGYGYTVERKDIGTFTASGGGNDFKLNLTWTSAQLSENGDEGADKALVGNTMTFHVKGGELKGFMGPDDPNTGKRQTWDLPEN